MYLLTHDSINRQKLQARLLTEVSLYKQHWQNLSEEIEKGILPFKSFLRAWHSWVFNVKRAVEIHQDSFQRAPSCHPSFPREKANKWNNKKLVSRQRIIKIRNSVKRLICAKPGITQNITRSIKWAPSDREIKGSV